MTFTFCALRNFDGVSLSLSISPFLLADIFVPADADVTAPACIRTMIKAAELDKIAGIEEFDDQERKTFIDQVMCKKPDLCPSYARFV